MIEFIIILTSCLIYTNYSNLYIINEFNNEYVYDGKCDFKYNYINNTYSNNIFNYTYISNNYTKTTNIKYSNLIGLYDMNSIYFNNIYNFNNYKLENYLKYRYLYDNRGCNCNIIITDIFICYYYDNLNNLELNRKSIKIYINENLVSLYPYSVYGHNNKTLRKILKEIKYHNIELYYNNYKYLLKKTYTTDLLNIIKKSYNIINNLWY